MILLNITKIKDKEYTVRDTKRFIKKEEKGIKEGFYGGRVDKLATTETAGVYMCMEDLEVIDLVIDPVETLKATLIDIAETKNIEVSPRATKEDISKLL